MLQNLRLIYGPLSYGLSRSAWLFAAILTSSLCIADLIGFSSELLARVEQQYGTAGKSRILAWQQTIYQNRQSYERDAIRNINSFFNQVPFMTDQNHWGVPDYWATPVELLATDAGDCEDYSIAKYFTLRELGVPDERLRITYVKASRSQWLDIPEAHMVLAYYPRPDAVPLILDSLTSEILPATQRGDLEPVYSFNGTGLWVAKEKGAGYTSLGNPGRIDFWRDMNIRMQQER